MHSTDPTFPPLMWGEAAPGNVMDHAVQRAVLGCDAGLVAYRLDPTEMSAALVFAPEVPLSKAMAMLPLCGVGLQNALGALAPPEVAVHLDWFGGLRINGAGCGRLTARAATNDPDEVPDWLVVGFTLPLLPDDENTGLRPDETALFAEGCSDVSPPALLESWARHSLNWISRWEAGEIRALHAEWRGLAHGVGEAVTIGEITGTFLGVDEDFGLLLRGTEAAGDTQKDITRVFPLTDLLKETQ